MRGRQEQQRKNEELLQEIRRDHKVDIKRVKKLLDNKAAPAFSILYAAGIDRIDIVNELLEAKADVHVKSLGPSYSTPLHMAIRCGSEEMVKRLLEARAQVNSERNSKRKKQKLDGLKEALGIVSKVYGDSATPLHFAAEKGHSRLVKILLEHQANINLKNAAGECAFECALRRDDAETISALLEAKACSRAELREIALMDVVLGGHPGAVKALLANNVSPNLLNQPLSETCPSLLSVAIENEDYESAQSLIAARIDIHRKGAIQKGAWEVIESNPKYEALYHAARAPGTITAVLAALHPRLGKASPLKTAYSQQPALAELQTMRLPLRLAGISLKQNAKINWFTAEAVASGPRSMPPGAPPAGEILPSSGVLSAQDSDSPEEEHLIMLP